MSKFDFTPDEQLVQQLVMDSKQQGITTANIVKKAGLNDKQVQKILKRLEQYEQIKSTRPSGKTTGVKFWIGFELEIETNLPNNPFRLSDQSFNQELIDKISQELIRFTTSQPNQQANLKDLQLVYKKYNSKAEFTEQDFNRILNVLLYDQVLEQVYDQNNIYRISPMKSQSFQFYHSYLPCQTCPVFNQCRPGNVISPENCIYQW